MLKTKDIKPPIKKIYATNIDIASKLFVKILYAPKANNAKLLTGLSNILLLSVNKTPPNIGIVNLLTIQ